MEKRSGRRRISWRILPLAALLAGMCWWDNFTVGLTPVSVASGRLPSGFDGFRVALLTDLHGRRFGKEQSQLLSVLREAKPELIALAGDIADEYTDLAQLEKLLPKLTAIAPCVYVTGNHEWRMKNRKEFFELLQKTGVTRLQNTYCRLTRGGDTIILAGVDDPNGPADQKTPAQLVHEIRKQEGQDAYILMLCHRNDQLEQFAALGVQLVLSGHAHGGVVRLPGIGAVFGTHYELFPKDTQGLCRSGEAAMVVSRGLGGSRRLPVRILNRPEIPLVILQTQ